MAKAYINGVSCISAQSTFSDFFLSEIIDYKSDNILYAIEPPYKDFIPAASIRRMSKGVKMSIVSAITSLKEAQVEIPESIIVGTGLGCLQDSEKFLKAVIDNKEEHLTPTAFIQSTHNTVAGQIAINLQCKGMNFTYVNGAISFESALLDAKMQIEQNLQSNILVGGVDEHSSHTLYLYEIAQVIKKKENCPDDFLNPKSKGIIQSEGATFFVLSDKQQENSYAELEDIFICNTLNNNEIKKTIETFLYRNHLNINNIDLIISGRNGDREDTIFFETFENLFPNAISLMYKHLYGEFYTASALSMWIGCNILNKKNIPSVLLLNDKKNIDNKEVKNILLYNQYRGKDHSLILLKNLE